MISEWKMQIRIENTNFYFLFKVISSKNYYSYTFMKSKLETSNIKFTRKNSRSPWDSSRYSHASEQDHVDFDCRESSTRYMGNKNGVVQKSKQTSVKIYYEDKSQERVGLKTFEIQPGHRSQIYINEQCRANTTRNGLNYGEDNKLMYINIESASTTQSLPTMRKKVSESLNGQLTTKRNQESQLLLKDIEKLISQNKYLQAVQNEKNNQIRRLSQQSERLYKKCNVIQNQLNETKKLLKNVQGQLKNTKITCENLMASIETKQFMKSKAQQRVKEFSAQISKLEEELRHQRSENSQILANSRILQKQFKETKKRLQSFQKQNNQKLGNKYNDDNLKTYRSLSIQDSYVSPQKCKTAMRTQQQIKRSQIKYNRYVQTESSKLEVVLKQNQQLIAMNMNKDNLIKNMQREIKENKKKLVFMDQLSAKLQESQKLLQNLNQKIISTDAARLSVKYKYY